MCSGAKLQDIAYTWAGPPHLFYHGRQRCFLCSRREALFGLKKRVSFEDRTTEIRVLLFIRLHRVLLVCLFRLAFFLKRLLLHAAFEPEQQWVGFDEEALSRHFAACRLHRLTALFGLWWLRVAVSTCWLTKGREVRGAGIRYACRPCLKIRHPRARQARSGERERKGSSSIICNVGKTKRLIILFSGVVNGVPSINFFSFFGKYVNGCRVGGGTAGGVSGLLRSFEREHGTQRVQMVCGGDATIINLTTRVVIHPNYFMERSKDGDSMSSHNNIVQTRCCGHHHRAPPTGVYKPCR